MAPRIIGLTGKQEAGKSTGARHLRETHGYAGSNLTDPMDEMLSPLLRRMGVPDHEILPRLAGGMKNVPIPGYEWLTGRKLKQAIGLEFRDAISRPLPGGGTDRGFFHDLWVGENAHHPLLVHEQVRYEFEARLIQRDGGVVYRIIDPDSRIQDGHESERDDFAVDAEILNPKTGVETLHRALDDLVGDAPPIPVSGSRDPLGDLERGMDGVINDDGPVVREIADAIDGGDERMAAVLAAELAIVEGEIGRRAVIAADEDQAVHARAAARRWFDDGVSASTTDRKVAAVLAHHGVDEGARRLRHGR